MFLREPQLPKNNRKKQPYRGMLLKVFNDMVPGIGVECVCPSGAMLAKAGTVLDVCLVGSA